MVRPIYPSPPHLHRLVNEVYEQHFRFAQKSYARREYSILLSRPVGALSIAIGPSDGGKADDCSHLRMSKTQVIRALPMENAVKQEVIDTMYKIGLRGHTVDEVALLSLAEQGFYAGSDDFLQNLIERNRSNQVHAMLGSGYPGNCNNIPIEASDLKPPHMIYPTRNQPVANENTSGVNSLR